METLKGFKPKVANRAEMVDTYKNYLLAGYILKYDGGATDFIEVIDRNNRPPGLTENVNSKAKHKLPKLLPQLEAAIKALENNEYDYIVLKKTCSGSGWGEYGAHLVYLEGETPFNP